MASIAKFTDSACNNELRHNNRLIVHDKNTDIDPERTKQNYSLTPYISIPKSDYYKKRGDIRKQEYDHYQQRKKELYCYNRSDVKTMAGCIVTLPKEISAAAEQADFFKSVTDFLSERYGSPNVVSVTIHYDEGRLVTQKLSGGNTVETFLVGQPHLHFNWIPACRIDHAALSAKSHHCTGMDHYNEKISANDVINKKDLQTLHKDLQKYLKDHGVSGQVLLKKVGEGKSLNLTVSQLKELSDRTGSVIDQSLSIEKLADILNENRDLEIRNKELETQIASLARDHERNNTWGNQTAWGNTIENGEKIW